MILSKGSHLGIDHKVPSQELRIERSHHDNYNLKDKTPDEKFRRLLLFPADQACCPEPLLCWASDQPVNNRFVKKTLSRVPNANKQKSFFIKWLVKK